MICIPINRRNLSQMKIWRLCIAVIVGLGFVQLMADSPSPRRDINAVLAAHDRQLLDLPAVVGVLADGKTPCLKVMLARPTPETERKIPREIEGFPVITEINTRIPINRLVVEGFLLVAKNPIAVARERLAMSRSMAETISKLENLPLKLF
jgi:hypothetical protein